MADEMDGKRQRTAWGSLALALAGLAVATALVLWRGLDWPSAIAACGSLVVAAITLLGPGGKHPMGAAEGVARRGTPLTDLTIEGLITALPAPAILLDARLIVRSHNARAHELIPGLRRGEPLTLGLRAPEVVEAVRAALATNTIQEVDYAERVPVMRWFRAEVTPVAITARGRDEAIPDFVLVSLRDLSESRRLERLRADFVANASHELRTPLASVLGFIETIQGPAKNDPPAIARFLEIMLAQARRMSRLIDDLLSLSRVELNEHVRPTDRIDLVPLIGHVRETLGPSAASQGVSVSLDCQEPSLMVAGDRDELIRLFENLTQNAIKYGAEGKKVEIAVTRDRSNPDREEAVVAVRDHGPGIPPEHLPRLTERFYRVDVVSSREKGGTGLGLALVKHIVNRHRGRLTIESPPGEGATFTVRLEAVASTESAA
ncbi:histidine kinase [Phreatobacter aquaticus]|uniref:histidine kinase n=1 Tax=Phreatobacter aquaticus TaxID=2570229 RepID=A0A4D7QFR4_9HYPH|nr:ATP-binding protein [Phreatobacter aquaticus]QCK84334.1 histidine kinase [Phreatobacter aquaticus]